MKCAVTVSLKEMCCHCQSEGVFGRPRTDSFLKLCCARLASGYLHFCSNVHVQQQLNIFHSGQNVGKLLLIYKEL